MGLLQRRLPSRQEIQGLSQSLNLNYPVSLEIGEFQYRTKKTGQAYQKRARGRPQVRQKELQNISIK